MKHITLTVVISISSFLFPVSAEAAIVKQKITGQFNFQDPSEPTKILETQDFDLVYSFEDSKLAFRTVEDTPGRINQYFNHGSLPGESLLLTINGQENLISSFNRSFGNEWGGPTPGDFWSRLSFQFNNSSYSFLFSSSNSELNNVTLPGLQDVWRTDISGEKTGFGQVSSITPYADAEAVPTPALLPGLIGMVAMLWKRKNKKE